MHCFQLATSLTLQAAMLCTVLLLLPALALAVNVYPSMPASHDVIPPTTPHINRLPFGIHVAHGMLLSQLHFQLQPVHEQCRLQEQRDGLHLGVLPRGPHGNRREGQLRASLCRKRAYQCCIRLLPAINMHPSLLRRRLVRQSPVASLL